VCGCYDCGGYSRQMSYAAEHLAASIRVIESISSEEIERVADKIYETRQNEGRIFFIGIGGSAANCSHAVNDFRKLCGIESYSPADNVSELTARANDDGWASIYSEWLKISRLKTSDLLFVMSVGGGSLEPMVSPNIVEALKYGKAVGAGIVGIVGRDGGFTAKVADACVIVPVVDSQKVTPHTEAFQAVIWHLLVSHPKLQMKSTKW